MRRTAPRGWKSAIDERTANGTMDWSKMKDPDSAKAYLGIE
ncbi:hypothetical protein [Streptomyces sp. LARHCF252]